MKTRSTVSVREGQGVVLLCGPPPHHGGTWSSSESGGAQTKNGFGMSFCYQIVPNYYCSGQGRVLGTCNELTVPFT